MSTAKVTYLGKLRTECEHLKSGNTFITDAPTDNNGKGEAFSPTDTVATGLANCMLTMMGIKSRDLDVKLDGSTAMVTKTMAANPRRISRIDVVMELPKSVDTKSRKYSKILHLLVRYCTVYILILKRLSYLIGIDK